MMVERTIVNIGLYQQGMLVERTPVNTRLGDGIPVETMMVIVRPVYCTPEDNLGSG